MKKETFNLRQYRTAYYEDARGQSQTQTRSYMNCYKAKVDAGMTAQAAWESCLKDYQNLANNDWTLKYASKKNDK